MKESLSLVALAEELERQRDAKEDRLVLPDQISVCTPHPTQATEVDLRSPAGMIACGLELSENAHGQFSDRLNVPKRFYDYLRGELPDLFDETVNRLLRHHPKGPPSKWLIRSLDGTVRAALSDQFRMIDNSTIADAVLPLFGREGIRVRSAHVSDQFMYIKATTPRTRGKVVGSDVCAGVCVRNSEIGTGKVGVYRFIETLECENGMLVTAQDEGTMEQVHLGPHLESDALGEIIEDEKREASDRALMMRVREAVRSAVSEAQFSELVDKMEEAAKDEPVRDPEAAVRVLAEREALTEPEGEGILRYLADGGDLSRWEFISAVTRSAADAESYESATALEAVGGKILDYKPKEWRELAHATTPPVS